MNSKNIESLIKKFPDFEEQLKRKVTNPYLTNISEENILASGSNNPNIFTANLTYCDSQIYYKYKTNAYFNSIIAEKVKEPQNKVVKTNIKIMEQTIKLTKRFYDESPSKDMQQVLIYLHNKG